MDKAFIHTEYIQLQQLLKWCGIAENGSMAKEMIRDGMVLVNGSMETSPGKKIFVGDQVTVEDIQYEVVGEYEK